MKTSTDLKAFVRKEKERRDGITLKYKVRAQTPLGEIVAGLLRSRGWSARELSRQIAGSGEHVALDYILGVITGRVKRPNVTKVNAMLAPFGYRAKAEMRIEPIEGVQK